MVEAVVVGVQPLFVHLGTLCEKVCSGDQQQMQENNTWRTRRGQIFAYAAGEYGVPMIVDCKSRNLSIWHQSRRLRSRIMTVSLTGI